MDLNRAVSICAMIELVSPKFGCHVALTGGCLYKHGERKDLDVLFYRIRQTKEIDYVGLFDTLIQIGFKKPEGFGWLFKSNYDGCPVDMFFPEEVGGGVYVTEDKRTAKERQDDKPLFLV
jgi:hypothetical protein